MNIADVLTRSAPLFAAKPILYFNDRVVSYDEFTGHVRRLTAALTELGARKGTRVILLADNRPEWLAAFFAIMAIGAVAVPVNPGLAAPEVRAIVEHCEPAIAIVQSELTSLLDGTETSPIRCLLDRPANVSGTAQAYADMQSDDPALIFYTSGTTGRPKGVVLSHGAELFAIEMFSRHLGITRGDTCLITGSLAFIYHLVLHALTVLNHGASLVLLERFHPEMAGRAIERHRISVVMAVPTAYVMMLNWSEGKACDFSSVRIAITAGATFPAALSRRLHQTLGFPVFDLWGMTECTPTTSSDPARDREGRPDSCGRPLPGCAVRIVNKDLEDLPQGEVGEVLLTSPAMMQGYYNNPQATAETIVDGWVRSGDLGKLDADGFLYVVGRIKDLIIRGGANIYPIDIEEVLYRHPAIGECAVIGIPDATYGEVVKAFVVLKDGKTATVPEIVEHCWRNVAKYKVPSVIQFVGSLPKGPTGKILRRELREA